jgi:hypothetical protein
MRATSNAITPPMIINVEILLSSTQSSCSFLNRRDKKVSIIHVALNRIGARRKNIIVTNSI